MREIHLSTPPRPAAEQQERWKGAKLDDSHYDVLLNEDADVYKPDGELLVQFRKNILDPAMCARAYRVMRTVGGDVTNRGVAAVGKSGFSLRKDGTRSKTQRVLVTKAAHPELMGVGSGVIGYLDRMSARFPYCRQTAFNLDHPELFAECMDYIQAVDAVFRRLSPIRHAAQLAVVQRTHPDFVIHGTAFTTVTVNKNFRTFTHQDAGDLKEGFGVMSVLRGGRYTGGYTVFPEFRVAANMSTGDVLLADVHEWHGNTPIVGKKDQHERVTCVFYYREKMQFCKSAAEELEYAKNRTFGTPLIDRTQHTK